LQQCGSPRHCPPWDIMDFIHLIPRFQQPPPPPPQVPVLNAENLINLDLFLNAEIEFNNLDEDPHSDVEDA